MAKYLYCAFGESDIVAVADMPDNPPSAAASPAINASGKKPPRFTPRDR